MALSLSLPSTAQDAVKDFRGASRELPLVQAEITRLESELKKLDKRVVQVQPVVAKRRMQQASARRRHVQNVRLIKHEIRQEQDLRSVSSNPGNRAMHGRIIGALRGRMERAESAIRAIDAGADIDGEWAGRHRELTSLHERQDTVVRRLATLKLKGNELAYKAGIALLFEDRGYESLSPPFLRSLKITRDGLGVRYHAAWVDPETFESEGLNRANKLLKALRDHRRWLDGQIVLAEKELVNQHDQYQWLLKRYINGGTKLRYVQVALGLIKGAIKAKGNPYVFFGYAVEKAHTALLNEAFGKRSEWDIPNYPAELLEEMETLRGNPVVWANTQIGQLSKRLGRGKPLVSVHRRSAPPRIPEFLAKNLDLTRPKTYQRLVKLFGHSGEFLESLKDGAEGITEAMVNLLTGDFRKLGVAKLSQALQSLGVDIGFDLLEEFYASRRDATFIKAVRVELEWFRARRNYHLQFAMARLVDKWIAVVMDEILDLNDTRYPWERSRKLVIHTDEVFTEGHEKVMGKLHLEFSRPVWLTGVKAGKDNLLDPKAERPKKPRKTYKVGFRMDPKVFRRKGTWTVRLAISAVTGDEDKYQLDGLPGSIPWFRTITGKFWHANKTYTDKWAEYSPKEPDRTHLIKLRRLDDTLSVMFLFDTSGSMKEGDLIGLAKSRVSSLARTLSRKGDVEFSVWVFSRNIKEILPFTTDPALVEKAVGGLRAKGNTPLSVAIRRSGEALVRTAQSPRKLLIVLTDGMNTDTGSVTAAVRFVRSLMLGVRVQRGALGEIEWPGRR